MTCIAGVAQDGVVVIGGDSAGVSGWAMTVRADKKVFQNGEFIFGFTSSFRMGQLLRYAFDPPAHAAGVETMRYLTTTFIDAVRGCLKEGGYAKVDKNAEEGGTFLLGYQGRLFTVDCDYQICETVDEVAACGCGRDIALGAMYALFDRDPSDRVRTALRAAERWSAGVRGPFEVISL